MEVDRMAYAERGCCLVLMVLAGFLASRPAEAAVTRTPFQAYINNQTCPSGADCEIDFPAVPTNYRIEIINVSCYLSGKYNQQSNFYTDPDYVQLLVQTDAGANLAAPVLVPQYIGVQFPGKIVFASNDIISVFATAKQHFQVLAHSSEGQFLQLACNISGQKVKLS
jgi:hypothetical protein